MKTISVSIIGFAMLALFASPLLSQPAINASPDEIVAFLTSLRHGLRDLDPASQTLVDRIRSNPDRFVNAISSAAKLPTSLNDLPEQDALRRNGGALGLAKLLPVEQGVPIARDMYLQATKLVRECETNIAKTERCPVEVKQFLTLLRGSALDVVGSFRDPCLIPNVLDSIRDEGKGTDVIMLRYLLEVAPLQPDIRPKLDEFYNEKNSWLHKHPQLLAVLEAIDKAEAERRIERPNKRKKTEDKGDE